MKRSTEQELMADAKEIGQEMAAQLAAYLGPLLISLDRRLDSRLVRTFAATVVNIIRHRDRTLSLLLTELGELLTDGAHAPAGVKRLWRLLHSTKWAAGVVGDWLLAQADRAVDAAVAEDGLAFLVLDGSVIEKPTARKLEGLTKVRSAVADLLWRTSGGPPLKRPVVVPGFNWAAAVVTGMTGGLTLARMLWYSPQAPEEEPQRRREADWSVLGPLLARWGQKVVCLLDRAYDSYPFLKELLEEEAARFIVRWRRDFSLVAANGERSKASQLSARVRSWCKIWVYDARRGEWWRVGVAAVQVWLPDSSRPLWLVVARRKGRRPWWFLTTEDASTKAGAIWVIRAYARRWQVEWAFRYEKSELGMASIRVRLWAYRAKLWAIAELVHAFLLQLLVLHAELSTRVLRWCHRTGRRWAKVITPIYRLRHALANLWKTEVPTIAWSP